MRNTQGFTPDPIDPAENSFAVLTEYAADDIKVNFRASAKINGNKNVPVIRFQFR